MDVRIATLGALCDVDPSEQPVDPSRALHFRIEEFAALTDGRRLTLTDDLGWSTQSVGGADGDDPWAHLTAELVEASMRTSTLPDDAEQTGEKHRWARLATRLAVHGVETTVAELRHLPYQLHLSERVQAKLSG